MKKRWNELIQDIIESLPTIIISIGIIIVVSLLRLELHELLSLLVVGTGTYDGIRNYYKNQLPEKKTVIKQLSMLCVYVIITSYAWAFGGAWGVAGMVAATITVAGIILYRRWDQYMASVRHIESIVWGEPLDRKKR
jgi:hypothetical protein